MQVKGDTSIFSLLVLTKFSWSKSMSQDQGQWSNGPKTICSIHVGQLAHNIKWGAEGYNCLEYVLYFSMDFQKSKL